MKLIWIQLPTSAQVWLKSVLSVAVGGAIGAVTDMGLAALNPTTHQVELNRLDFHQVGFMALSGAVTALLHLWQAKPTHAVSAETVTPPAQGAK